MIPDYVHGHHLREQARLRDQAGTLVDLLHRDTAYPPGSAVLEVGCGVGAQTVTLARLSPGARITSFDRSAAAVAAARSAAAGLADVDVLQADLFAMPFAPSSFDHVFVCFVLEHLPEPAGALAILIDLLRPGGTLTVIDGDHGSTLFHPDSAAARTAIACQVELQRRAGGDPMIGRRLYPLLVAAGLADVVVSPRLVSVDGSRPDLARGFIEDTFTAMVAGVEEAAVAAGLVDREVFAAGLRDLRRTAEPDGTFCYTFFKGIGVKPGAMARIAQVEPVAEDPGPTSDHRP